MSHTKTGHRLAAAVSETGRHKLTVQRAALWRWNLPAHKHSTRAATGTLHGCEDRNGKWGNNIWELWTQIALFQGKARNLFWKEQWHIAYTDRMERKVSQFNAASCSQLFQKSKPTKMTSISVRIPNKVWCWPKFVTRYFLISAAQAQTRVSVTLEGLII